MLCSCASQGNKVFPTGILLNNPGNIRHSDDEWYGKTRFQNNKKFVRFSQPLYGIRALMKTLKTYEQIHGIHTINSIIKRWAPSVENNTSAYIIDVCDRTGIPQHVLIDITDKNVMIKLAKAIVIHENGVGAPLINWYSDSLYAQAADMVLGEE